MVDEPEMPLSEMPSLGIVPPGPTVTLAEMQASLCMGVSYPVMTKGSVELREFPPRRELRTLVRRVGVSPTDARLLGEADMKLCEICGVFGDAERMETGPGGEFMHTECRRAAETGWGQVLE